ncbi:HAD-IB family hydrolase [Sphingomonas ginkgonis]|uniref:HAD-IB family hydrolase n=1 Tax=Sphingomonas ginkgonis TaxID=2315330 RepID=A0A429V7Z6_9SPHN|nr:HAD-IB family hydrolase [Sphingomonas ginkgonis]RST30081.1 HAD-IB family hydrolase [Sphingomonas ginkgonis]
MTDLAIYDLDKTVTRVPTYTPFLLMGARTNAPWRLALVPVAATAMLFYAARIISRPALKELNQRLLLGARSEPEQFNRLVEAFAEHTLATNINPGARRQIERDKAEGQRLVLATASYEVYAGAIARRLGFDDTIGTALRLAPDGRVLARIDGENCYGPSKKTLVDRWLARKQVAPGKVRFYSDHASDAPMFEWADEPVAVNPHAALRRLAAERGWRVEDWRR